MSKERLSSFAYKFDRGPIPLSAFSERVLEGNCRLALQDFFLVFHGRYFAENELLNPAGYLNTGSFVKGGGTENLFDGLDSGTVIYAESIRNKRGELVDKSPALFPDRDAYLIALHTAVFIRELNEDVLSKLPPEILTYDTQRPAIWHASAIEGGEGLWSIEKFLEYYKPVAAKRFV